MEKQYKRYLVVIATEYKEKIEVLFSYIDLHSDEDMCYTRLEEI